MSGAVLPSPTFTVAKINGLLRSHRSLWLMIFAAVTLAICAGIAQAQGRNWTGEVGSRPAVIIVDQPKDPDEQATASPRTRAAATPKASTLRARSQALPAPKLNPAPKVKQQVPKTVQEARHSSLREQIPSPVVVPAIASVGAETRWQEIRTVLRPARLIELCEKFQRDYPASAYSDRVTAVATGARQAIIIQRVAGLSGDFFDDDVGDEAYRNNLREAVHGDKDAAYRIAQAYKTGQSGVAASPRRMEQWLRFSVELGSGSASWELAEIYNLGGLVADAARFEKRAIDLGFRPPPRLSTRGY